MDVVSVLILLGAYVVAVVVVVARASGLRSGFRCYRSDIVEKLLIGVVIGAL